MVRRVKKHQPRKSELGQSLIELAFSFLLLMLLLGGAVDFGRVFFAMIALRDASQEGVVYGSGNPDDVPGIETRVQLATEGPIDMTKITADKINVTWILSGVTCAEGQTSPATCVTKCADFYVDAADGNTKANYVAVDVEYDFPFAMPIIQALFPGGTLTLHVKDSNAIIAPQCD